MTTDTNPQNQGNRDNTAPRTGAGSRTGAESQGQTQRAGQDQGTRPSLGTSSRDEGSRNNLRATPDSGAKTQGRDGASDDVLCCLDTIQENVAKIRSSLSASGGEGSIPAGERQTNEGGPSPSRTASTKPASDQTRTLNS